jgi:hypothetical protein
MRLRLVVPLVSIVPPALALGPVAKHVGVGAPTPLDTDPPSTAIPPVPVQITNFPAVQAVAGTMSIDNLPVVQQVGGTVSVGNLPSVQAVQGNVNVGNLPLNQDGSLRVSGAARQPVTYELLSEPVTAPVSIILPTAVDTTGYSRIGVLVRTNASGGQAVFTALWRWNDDEEFFQMFDGRCSGSSSIRYLCESAGGFVKFTLQDDYPGASVTSFRVTLFP